MFISTHVYSNREKSDLRSIFSHFIPTKQPARHLDVKWLAVSKVCINVYTSQVCTSWLTVAKEINSKILLEPAIEGGVSVFHSKFTNRTVTRRDKLPSFGCISRPREAYPNLAGLVNKNTRWPNECIFWMPTCLACHTISEASENVRGQWSLILFLPIVINVKFQVFTTWNLHPSRQLKQPNP